MHPLRPAIYLAGPAVFRPDAAAVARRLHALCADSGCEGLFPGDAEVETGLHGAVRAQAILAANLALLRRADGVLADCTPFRGPSVDPGTAFEIGHAVARGIPVAGWSAVRVDYRLRVPGATRGASGWCDRDGLAVEDFGLADNLMIAASLIALEADAAAALARLVARLRTA